VRVAWLFLPAALLVLAAAEARAQYGGPGGEHYPEDRHKRPTHADSTRTLAGPRQIWTHFGMGWLATPSDAKSRYNAGLDAGLSADRRFFDHLAARLKLDYHDLPSHVPTVLYLNGASPVSGNTYGHGWLASALAGAALRTLGHVWLEGELGTGYFDSGYPSGTQVPDPVTGQLESILASSGWGPIWSAGARYEFKPTLRDRLLAEVQFLQMDHDGTRLQFWSIRVGYRAF